MGRFVYTNALTTEMGAHSGFYIFCLGLLTAPFWALPCEVPAPVSIHCELKKKKEILSVFIMYVFKCHRSAW